MIKTNPYAPPANDCTTLSRRGVTSRRVVTPARLSSLVAALAFGVALFVLNQHWQVILTRKQVFLSQIGETPVSNNDVAIALMAVAFIFLVIAVATKSKQ